MLQVCPEYKRIIESLVGEVPEEMNIVETQNYERFYRVIFNQNTLFLPHIKYIKTHLSELDKVAEAVLGFVKNPAPQLMYDWENLNLTHYEIEEEIIQFIDFLETQKELACDIETRNLAFHGNKLLAIGFAWSESDGGTFSLFTDKVLARMEQLFLNKNISFIWQGGKFDCGRLKFLHNLSARIDEDTMYMHFAGINEKKGTHGLKDMGGLYLQAPAWDDELDRYKKKFCAAHKIKLSEFTYDMIPVEILIPYLGRDIIATYRLAKLFKQIMRPNSMFIYYKIVEAANEYKDMEIAGMAVNTEYISTLDVTLQERIIKAQNDIKEVAQLVWNAVEYQKDTGAKALPKVFNQNSPAQLKWIYKAMGIKIASTDKETMASIRDQLETLLNNEGWRERTSSADQHDAERAHHLTVAVQELRKLNKMHKTYVVGIQNQIEADGRVHSTFNLHGTETGRLSSSDPNMHNIPRDKTIKNLFIATPGKVLVQFDYSQAELRVLAFLSGDEWLKQVYVDGKDLHDAVATEMFGPDFTKEQRVQAKTINFGIAYGRGPANLSKTFNMTFLDAKQLINDWFVPMPKVKAFIDERRARPQRGIVCDTPFGRERHFVITDDNLVNIQNESVNFPIQSVASDFTVFSLIEINREIKKINEREGRCVAQIVNTVHDSIILDAEPEFVDELVIMGTTIMRDTPVKYLPECTVPFRADAETGLSWGALETA